MFSIILSASFRIEWLNAIMICPTLKYLDYWNRSNRLTTTRVIVVIVSYCTSVVLMPAVVKTFLKQMLKFILWNIYNISLLMKYWILKVINRTCYGWEYLLSISLKSFFFLNVFDHDINPILNSCSWSIMKFTFSSVSWSRLTSNNIVMLRSDTGNFLTPTNVKTIPCDNRWLFKQIL